MKRTKSVVAKLPLFERYLTLWVALCIVIGVSIGKWFPAFPRFLNQFEYAQVSIPVAILIWFMIYPMMVQIDFKSIVNAGKKPKGLIITLIVNWLIKPFSMYLIAWFFFKVVFRHFIPVDLSNEYLAGAVLLGAVPCTAMVFVWSYLSKGDPAYTLVQVAVNDIVILVAFAPIVKLLLGLSSFTIPFTTIFLSVILFVLIPLILGWLSRQYVIKTKGEEWLNRVFIKQLGKFTIIGLLLTLVTLFAFQGDRIIHNPQDIVLIAIPLIIQTFLIFFIGYLWAKIWKVSYSIAAPAGMIGASNFFELSVAVAIALPQFGLNSGATLATVVGVLVEVPVMLGLVRIALRTRRWFKEE